MWFAPSRSVLLSGVVCVEGWAHWAAGVGVRREGQPLQQRQRRALKEAMAARQLAVRREAHRMPSLAQLVERETVVTNIRAAISRSVVQFRQLGYFFFGGVRRGGMHDSEMLMISSPLRVDGTCLGGGLG